MATNAHLPLLTVEDFLEIDFGPDRKAELDNGVIRMMAGGTAAHNRVCRNLLRLIGNALQGTGCSPYGSDMGIKTGAMGLRYPDVAVFCGRDDPDNDAERTFDDPRLVIEVLSPSTAVHDLSVKLREYQALPSTDAVLFVDPIAQTVRLFAREGRHWSDDTLAVGATIDLPTLGVSLPLAEVFARG